eukprot:CAMPEP_0118950910 /NCGR_PEP_ID=MMETSP1169-20130426/52211_1 /TAXON_ID=36882 /ORGANISM="Pyramimonas obovata, Strain CCMP722" /LENGTH=154 /DNA_ID=CAMNT_0006897849 /DNA_START=261 /DNA_END=722 /DNA_ORIENTATION=+
MSKGEYKEALKFCKAALQHDKKNYNVFIFIGKAAFKLGEFAQSELAYRKAVDVDSEKTLAWQGLLEIFTHLEDNDKAVDPLKELLRLTTTDKQKHAELTNRLAATYKRLGKLKEAQSCYDEVLEQHRNDPLPPSLCLPALCSHADHLLQLEEEA